LLEQVARNSYRSLGQSNARQLTGRYELIDSILADAEDLGGLGNVKQQRLKVGNR
jgi:hypothetical protein